MESTINQERKIGIEIECVVPIIGTGSDADVQNLLAQVLSNHGLRACFRNYCRQPLPQGYKFAVEHDSSLRDESKYQGLRWSKIEVKTSPMVWSEVERCLPPALEIIDYFGARCNFSTGLHVHHHMPEALERAQVVRNLQHLWWRFHEVLYGLVPTSRKSNQYCRPPRQEDATRFDLVSSYPRLCGELHHMERYEGLNLTNLAVADRMTVEWRIHGGTTDWDKIRAWILATQRWTEHAISRNCHFKSEPITNNLSGLNALLVTTGLKANSRVYCKVDKELRQAGRFLRKRWKHFNLPKDYKAKAAAA